VQVSELSVRLEWGQEFYFAANVEWDGKSTSLTLHIAKDESGAWYLKSGKLALSIDHIEVTLEGAQPCVGDNAETTELSGALRLYDLPSPMAKEIFGSADVTLVCENGTVASWSGDFTIGGGETWEVDGVGTLVLWV
jgi:hypothetical protein